MNIELKKLYEDDQSIRTCITDSTDWQPIIISDAARRLRAQAIFEDGGMKDAIDFKHGAMVFQHGTEPKDILRAHEFAKRSMELDPNDREAQFLFAASYDRYMHYIGQPQIYGTHARKFGGEPWTLEPFNRVAVTDDERRALNIRTLSEVYEWLAELNSTNRY